MKLFRRPESESGPLADVGADVDRELQGHLDERTDALMREGRTADDARAQALKEFGDVDDARRYMREVGVQTAHDTRRRFYMEELRQDIRHALRRLASAPAFTATSVITLALGIGATTAIFSLVYGILFRPMPFPEPERLYAVYSTNVSSGSERASVSAVDLDDWRAARKDIQDLGGVYYSEGSSGVDLTGRGDPRRVPAAFFTPGLFDALAVTPTTGRLPREDEQVRGGPDDIALLSYGFWQREFGGATDIVGQTLNLSDRPYRVIGVLPASLNYPSKHADVFIPYSTIPDDQIPRLRAVRNLDVVARAKPGVGLRGVQAEMSAITARIAQTEPANRNWGNATVVPLAEAITGPVRDGLLVLLGAVALVLLMAAVNVAALQVARAAERGRELAVRLALGARRGRIVRQLLTESLVLAGIGCAAGVALSYGLVRALLVLVADQLPRTTEVTVDTTAVAFAVGVSLLSGLLFGVAPALRAIHANPQDALGAGARGTVGGQSQRLRSSLVVAEVAVAMVLVVGAGLMGRTFMALINTDTGFTSDRLLGVQFTVNPARNADPTGTAAPGAPNWQVYYRSLIDTVREIPGVESAAAVKNAPFRGNGEVNSVSVSNRPTPPGEDPPTARVIHISDGYFATIGARMVSGREFTTADRDGTPFVVIVNEALQRQLFPGENPVGQTLKFWRSAEIVGVVNDIRQASMSEPATPTVYLNNLQNGRVQTTIVARTKGAPLALVPAIREAIWRLDKDQAISEIFTFEDSVNRSLSRPRLLVVLLGGFGVLGLVLGAVGIYGVLAALVNQRRREIGMRIVLGARPADVVRMVVSRGLMLAGVGIGLGLIGAWVLTGFLSNVLYGVTATDPLTFVGVVLVLLAAAAAASWRPAARAAHVDPAVAIRAD